MSRSLDDVCSFSKGELVIVEHPRTKHGYCLAYRTQRLTTGEISMFFDADDTEIVYNDAIGIVVEPKVIDTGASQHIPVLFSNPPRILAVRKTYLRHV